MQELRGGFFFLLFSIFVLWESVRVGLGALSNPGAGFVSFCAGVALFALSLTIICRSWGVREALETQSISVVIAAISLFTYSFVLETMGFIPATFLLLGILFRLGQTRPWWTLLWMSGLVTVLAYFIFGKLLHVYFPRGLLGI
jgi:hypothetical protein